MNNLEKINILLVEPAFRSTREPVLKNSKLINKNINLYIACGLHFYDSNWALNYAKGRFDFSYTENNLVEKIKKFSEENNIHFSGVVSYLDSSIKFVNDACHELELPVISSYLGNAIKNKFEVRKILKENNIDQDFWFRRAANLEDLNNIIDEGIVYPIIAKPTEMMASLGVVKINSEFELRQWFPLILKVDFEGEDLREKYGDIESSVILEQFISGDEYSAETVVVNGIPQVFGITKKYTSSGLYWDEIGHSTPPVDLNEENIKNIKSYILNTHQALKFQNTITHTEFRMSSDRPIIMEINPRLAGDYIYLIQEKLNRFSTGDLMFQAGLGVNPKIATYDSLNVNQDNWSVRFITETQHVRVIKENNLVNTIDQDVTLINYVDSGDVLFKTKETFGNRVGAIISKTNMIYPEIRYQNDYLSEFPLKILEKGDLNLGIFHAQEKDLLKMTEIEACSWSKEHASSFETISARFKANPKEHLVCIDLKSKQIHGFFSLVKVLELEKELLNKWDNLAQISLVPFGHRAKTNSKFIMCGVSLTVSPDAPLGVGSLLVEASIIDSIEKGAITLNYSTRVPNFKKWMLENKNKDIHDYLEKVLDGSVLEPILKIAQRNGGRIVRVLNDYFKDDDSLDHGIMIEHRLD